MRENISLQQTNFMRTSAKVIGAVLIVGIVIIAAVLWMQKAPTPTPGDETPITSTPGPKDDLIVVTSPKSNDTITSPITVEGKARGMWYFEASFPVQVLDANNVVLGSTTARALGNWMTEDFVPFTASVTFTPSTTATGTLVLKKDNPSGLPENDDELRIPVRFNQQVRPVNLYYYDLNKDQDGKGILLCSKQGLIPVSRAIPISQTPIQDTINLLLKGDITAQERDTGIATEFPLTDVTLKGASLKGTALTLEFVDPQHKTSGGSCRARILWYQIEATALQFPEVESVSFIPADLFQP